MLVLQLRAAIPSPFLTPTLLSLTCIKLLLSAEL